jgi:hypothetical protein
MSTPTPEQCIEDPTLEGCDEETEQFTNMEMYANYEAEPNKALVTFAVIWSLLGVVAFFTSLVCFGFKSSSLDQKVLGLLVALILGPFYWLYFYFAKDYCRRK